LLHLPVAKTSCGRNVAGTVFRGDKRIAPPTQQNSGVLKLIVATARGVDRTSSRNGKTQTPDASASQPREDNIA